MKAKLFYIRQSKEFIQKDEENINQFMDSVSVKKTATNFVLGTINYWSVLVFFIYQSTMNKE